MRSMQAGRLAPPITCPRFQHALAPPDLPVTPPEAAASLLTRPAATSPTHLHAHATAQVGGRAEPDERQPLCGAPMCERGAPIGAVHGQGDAEEDEHRQRVHAVLQLQQRARGRGQAGQRPNAHTQRKSSTESLPMQCCSCSGGGTGATGMGGEPRAADVSGSQAASSALCGPMQVEPADTGMHGHSQQLVHSQTQPAASLIPPGVV